MIFTKLCRSLGMRPERVLPRRLRIREECQFFLARLEDLVSRKERPNKGQDCPVCGRKARLEAERDAFDPLRRVRVRLSCTVCPHTVSTLVRPEKCAWALPMASESDDAGRRRAALPSGDARSAA